MNINIPVKYCGDTLTVILFATIITFTLCGFVHSAKAASIVHVIESDQWNYFTGTEVPAFKWNYPDFDDSNWLKGQTGLGYGVGSYRTSLSDMKNHYLTVYARREFIIDNPSAVTGITFSLICDGPFVAYINGNEAIRNPVAVPIQLDLSSFAEMLLIGRNVFAVQCSNDDINSNDFSFTPFFDVLQKQERQR